LLAIGAICFFVFVVFLRARSPWKAPGEPAKPMAAVQRSAGPAQTKGEAAVSPQAPESEAAKSSVLSGDPPLGAIAGRVVSEGSLAPIQGAILRLTYAVPRGSTEKIPWIASGATDAAGRFLLQGLERAPYWVRASKAGYRDQELKPVFPGSSQEIILRRDPGVPCTLELDSGDGRQPLSGQRIVLEISSLGWELETQSDAQGAFSITGVDRKRLDEALRVGELEVIVADFADPDVEPAAGGEGYTVVVEKGKVVFGRVTDRASKAPIPRATLVSDSGQTATADDQGNYRISGVTDGLTAFAPGYAAMSQEIDDTSEESNDTAQLNFRLRRGLSLHGRVTSSSGSPLSRVRVGLAEDAFSFELETIGLESKLSEVLSSVTDGEGRYRLEGLPPEALDLPGSIELQVRPPGCARGVSEDVDVEIEEGDVEHDIKLDLADSFRGTILRHDHSPLGGASVLLESVEEELYQVSGTDGEGKFELKNIPEGQYRLGVILDETPLHVQVVSVPSEPLLVRLERGRTVAGTVVSREDREPIPDLRVDLVFFRGELILSRGALTDASGKFSFEEVPRGEYSLEIRQPALTLPFASLGPLHRIPVEVTQEDWSQEVLYPGFPSGWITFSFAVSQPGGESTVPLEPVEVRVVSFHSTGVGVRDWFSKNGTSLGRATGTFHMRLREGTYVFRCAWSVEGKERTKDEALTLQPQQTVERQVLFSN
jgi:hypothetical protein